MKTTRRPTPPRCLDGADILTAALICLGFTLAASVLFYVMAIYY